MLWQFLIGMFWYLWPFTWIDLWERGLLIIAGRWAFRLGPGIWPRVPLLMKVEVMPIKESTLDLPTQPLETLDSYPVGVSGRVVYEISDIRKCFLDVDDPEDRLESEAMFEIAQYVAYNNYDEISKGEMEKEVLPALQAAAPKWGINVIGFGITHLIESRAYYIMTDGGGTEVAFPGLED